MRKIGGGTWLTNNELEEGIVFNCAKFIGFDESEYGDFAIFQDMDDNETYNMAGNALMQKCDSIDAGDMIHLVYGGKKKLTSGKMSGKLCHMFDMFLLTDDEIEEMGFDKPKPVKKATKKRTKSKPAPEPEEVDDDEVEEVEEAPKRRAKKAKKAVSRKKADVVEVEEDDEVEEEEEVKPKRAAKKAKKAGRVGVKKGRAKVEVEEDEVEESADDDLDELDELE